GVRRERPARQVRVIVGEEPAGQVNGVGAGVVEFHPRVVFTRVVGEAGNVFRLDFVDPKWWERRQRGANGVQGAGRVTRAGWILDRLNVLIAANTVAGKAQGQDDAVGAGQVPIAQRVRRVGDERAHVLP